MTAPVCTVSGVLTDAVGVAKARALVHARVLDGRPGAVPSGTAVAIERITTLTDAAGAWQAVLPQGARVRIQIPAAGIDHEGTIPSASAVAFDVLFRTMTPCGDRRRPRGSVGFPTF